MRVCIPLCSCGNQPVFTGQDTYPTNCPKCGKDLSSQVRQIWNGVVEASPPPEPSVCQIAHSITTGERSSVYGHPAENFGNIAKHWSTYLGVPITAEQVAVCQILVKVERLHHAPGHRDSIIDICGYGNCAGMILDKGAKA